MSNNTENWKTDDQRAERKQRLQKQKTGGKKPVKSTKTGKNILIAVLVIALVLGAVAIFMIDGGYLERSKTAGTVNGKHKVTPLEMNYYLGSNVNAMYQAAAFTPNGRSILTIAVPSEDGFATLRDVLINGAEEQISEIYALSDRAKEAGIEMDEENKQYLDSMMTNMEMAALQQQLTTDDLLSRLFGRGATLRSLKPILERQLLAALYQEHAMDNYDFSDEEIEDEYEANKDDYDKVAFHAFAVHPDNPAFEEEDAGEQTDELAAQDLEDREPADKDNAETADTTEVDGDTNAEEVDNTDAEQAADAESEKPVALDEDEVDETAEDASDEAKEAAETDEITQAAEAAARAEAEAKYDAALAKAEEMAADVKTEADFHEWATKLATPEQKPLLEEEDTTLVKGAIKSQLTPEMAAWLFDPERQEGDVQVMDIGGVPTVLYYVSRGRDESRSFSSRHILIKDETNEDEEVDAAATETRAQEILDKYLAGEQTEEAFADLAKEFSEDPGSKENGGLYEDIPVGQFVPAYQDWCLDSAREVGDVGMVRVESPSYSGYHIIYFKGLGDLSWQSAAKAALGRERFNQALESIKAHNTFTPDESGMKYVLPYDAKSMESVRESIQELEDSFKTARPENDEPDQDTPEAGEPVEQDATPEEDATAEDAPDSGETVDSEQLTEDSEKAEDAEPTDKAESSKDK